ncbi:MAG: sensor histidine kinase [Lachnospiraceae bacterium]|nr:sensor histidine kinase [Lachnospiraceae bacterium]
MNIKKKFNSFIHLFTKASLARNLIIVIFIAFFLFSTAFIISTSIISRQAKRESEIKESETLINTIVDNIYAGLDNYNDISRLIMLNESVNDFLKAENVDSGLVNDTIYGVMDILNVCTDVDSVFIFRNDGEYMKTGKGNYDIDLDLMNTTSWKSVIMGKRGGAVISINANDAIFRTNKSPIITIGRSIYNIYTQKLSGLLLMNISINMIDKITGEPTYGEIAFLSDEGEYLTGSSNGKSLSGFFDKDAKKDVIIHRERYIDNKSQMVSTYSFSDIPIVIICSNYIPSPPLPSETVFVLLLLFGAFVVAIFVAGIFMARNINRPLHELTSAMEKTKESGWMKRMDVSIPDNEIGELAKSYNSMIEYLNDLFTRLIDEEKSLQRAEMRVLQEQIKPHFLYNSLETISFMALEDGSDKVYEALEHLGSFYRNFLSKGDREISLKREINIITDYLSLQKLRYGDIIRDEYDIAKDTLELHIPKLILQPLVENSIYHGIRPKGEECLIRISSRIQGNDLIISVYDTGIGMSEEMIQKVLHGERDFKVADDQSPPSGFGLRGTIDRIRYYCDREDVVSIESEEGEYTRIDLTIFKAAADERMVQDVQSNAD